MPTYDFAKFSQKNCMESRKYCSMGGDGGAPLVPPMKALYCSICSGTFCGVMCEIKKVKNAS